MTSSKKKTRSVRRIRNCAATKDDGTPGNRGAEPGSKNSKSMHASAHPIHALADEDPNSKQAFASPPCFMHELDPSYLRYMTEAEVLEFLNELLEAERAGARGVGAMSKQVANSQDHVMLHDIAKDEARFCAMLTRHISRLGGAPSTATGAFYEKLMALESRTERLELLDRGQRWVIRKLREALPCIVNEALYQDLKDMLATHEINVGRGAELLE